VDINIFLAFATICIFEAFIPGPTLALVIETRVSSGKKAAMATVAGITIANVIWVAVALFVVFANAKWLPDGASVPIQIAGAAFLVYLACRRLLSLAISLFSAQPKVDSSPPDPNKAYLTGFVVHFANPLSVAFYIATFSVIINGHTLNTAILFGAIPVLIDLALFTVLSTAPTGALAYVPRWISRLLAGLLLLYLVGHAYSKSSTISLSMTPLTALMMLVGFYVAAIAEAKYQVGLRKEGDNKLVWRTVALWGAWFSVAALLGGLYTLIGGFGVSTFALDHPTEHRIRICFVVAAVLATTLSFAKAYGELQDEKFPRKSDTKSTSIHDWRTAPLWVGGQVFGFLALTFILLWITDFSVN
jgi:threonine/homoserine/homoserine lactone efflux protein